MYDSDNCPIEEETLSLEEETPIEEETLSLEEETPMLDFHPQTTPPKTRIVTHFQGDSQIQGGNTGGDTSDCIVEEEIPPSWQVTQNTPNNAALEEAPPENADEDMDLEQPLLTPHRFSDDHLQIIFDMRRTLDDQMHNQRILGQRMDLLFDALTDAPDKKRCPTCGQKFVPAYNTHGQSGLHIA
jgi:hypothetical protein